MLQARRLELLWEHDKRLLRERTLCALHPLWASFCPSNMTRHACAAPLPGSPRPQTPTCRLHRRIQGPPEGAPHGVVSAVPSVLASHSQP